MIAWTMTALFFFIWIGLAKLHLPRLTFRREEQLAKGISIAIEHRGPFLSGTTQEIVEISDQVAEVVGLNSHERARTEIAARLCDLGLCGVSSELLLKRSEWTPEEEAIYDRHPDEGAEMLAKSPALKKYAKIVRFHHSRFEVVPDAPIESRILCVASDFVKNRRTLGVDRAILALERQSGLHYDPEIVDAIKFVLK